MIQPLFGKLLKPKERYKSRKIKEFHRVANYQPADYVREIKSETSPKAVQNTATLVGRDSHNNSENDVSLVEYKTIRNDKNHCKNNELVEWVVCYTPIRP